MLKQETIDLIKDNQALSIAKKQLTDEQLQLIYDNQWFNIWVPKTYGGLEMSLVDGCRLLEELAYWDAGLSWTITLCSGANMFAGFIDEDFAKEMFENPKICLGGSGKVGGTARSVEGGYIITGSWPYATGAPHLTHFTANCQVVSDSLMSPDQVQSFVFRRDDVLIHYDWDTFGLEATASHTFSVDEIFVPHEYTFLLDPIHAKHRSLLFQYPFKPFAELTLFVNYLGVFHRFCDLVHKLFYHKSQHADWNAQYGSSFFKCLDKAEQLAVSARAEIYTLLEQSWDNLGKADVTMNEQVYQEIAKQTRIYLEEMKQHVVVLFPKCGIVAAQKNEELNTVFRNFFTATQHGLLNVQQ